jgi:hypothetical protein
MKATIAMKNGTRQEGYFGLASYLYIEKEGEHFRYNRFNESIYLRSSKIDSDRGLDILETDYHFHTHIRSLLSMDTLKLYPNVTMIYVDTVNPDSETVAVPLGRPSKLPSIDIEEVIIQKVYFSSLEAVNTKCEYEDLEWLKNRVVSRESIDIDMVSLCTYRVIFFRENKNKVQPILTKLTRAYRTLEHMNQKGSNSRK